MGERIQIYSVLGKHSSRLLTGDTFAVVTSFHAITLRSDLFQANHRNLSRKLSTQQSFYRVVSEEESDYPIFLGCEFDSLVHFQSNQTTKCAFHNECNTELC